MIRRRVLFLIGIAISVFLFSTSSKMSHENGKPLNGNEKNENEVAQPYINNSRYHKLFIDEKDEATYEALRGRGAIIKEIDYGSFKMVVVNDDVLGGRNALNSLSVSVRDDQNLIWLNGFTIDTTEPETTYQQIPAGLRRAKMSNALAARISPAGGLFLVQFAGPIQDDWLRDLKNT